MQKAVAGGTIIEKLHLENTAKKVAPYVLIGVIIATVADVPMYA